MRFLLTNDDGHDAPGLAALARAATPIGECVVVAPLNGTSGCGHQVTGHRPLTARQLATARWSVDGWPADCVRVALRGLDIECDWVLSGINAGGNLGADSYVSGTVAAVREAALLGKPGIALSQYKRRDHDFDWDRATAWVARLLPDLLSNPPPSASFWSVNLPHLDAEQPDPAVVFCPLDPHPLPVLYRREEGNKFVYCGDYHKRPREVGSDVEVCLGGAIAITLVRFA